MEQENLKDHNMLLVGLTNIGILTNCVQKSSWTLQVVRPIP